MDLLRRLFHTLFPLTQEKMNDFIQHVGPGKFYAIVFAIIFCETGLVVTPFLPGDSLLFTLGAIGAHPEAAFSLPVMGALLVAAALLGDNTNYWIGYRIGPKIFRLEEKDWSPPGGNSSDLQYATPAPRRDILTRLMNKKHLAKAHEFYERYGSKTVILARFVPIVRTFAPFVAGVARMNYARFLMFSIIGAVAWVSLCMGAGCLFGGLEFVKKHFEVVVVAIVVISVIPIGVEYLNAKRREKAQGVEVEK